TIGQRKGLNIGGKAEGMFVLGTDTVNNILYVGMGEQHPGLHRNGLFIPNKDMHWVRRDLEMSIGEKRSYQARIRYRQALSEVDLHRHVEGLYITFNTPAKAVAAGQFAAWYEGDELIGSGVIS
ncbi:MAG: tRNA 2-thiouridine(34) synthase MnmA, partial [Bacteroidetes bacterium]|nr:tRNA 2-thiouridine(34) synthase MnmA [Bacteroidota bacterium]